MALFGSETSGEIALEGMPDDIVERLERRVAEQRWVDADDAQSTYRVCERPERALGYRDGPERVSSIRVQLLEPASGPILEDVELDFSDPRHVRFHARFPRLRKVSFIGAAALGFIFGAIAVVMAWVTHHPAAGVAMGIAAAIVTLFVAFMSVADAKERAPKMIEKILREEIAASRSGSVTATGVTAQAVLAVLDARGIELTEEDRALVLATKDAHVLDDLLKKAATATRIDDVLERRGGTVRVATDEEEDPVSAARARRGSG